MKNRKHQTQIVQLLHPLFPDKKISKIEELKEGLFNAAYLITLENQAEVVLKIAPDPKTKVMSYEKNLMLAEIASMQLISKTTAIPLPKILYADTNCTRCQSPYFIMEKMRGKSLSSQANQLSSQEQQKLQVKIGKLNREINAIRGEKFGYIGHPELQQPDWYQTFQEMLRYALADAARMKVELRISIPMLWEELNQDQEIFEEVITPYFVHWDLWAANIFVENGEVTGVIDWERSLWGDPLMEVGFRTYQINQDFLEGYGNTILTNQEYRRAIWYDIYLGILVASEGAFRQYSSQESYGWAIKMLSEKLAELRNWR